MAINAPSKLFTDSKITIDKHTIDNDNISVFFLPNKSAKYPLGTSNTVSNKHRRPSKKTYWLKVSPIKFK